MKLNNKYIIGAAIISLLISTSCVDDMNVDPNRPSSVPTTTLITSSEKLLIDNIRNENISLRGSMLFVQYFAQNSYTSQSRYDIPFSYSDDYWQDTYSVLNNLQDVIKLNTNPDTRDVAAANGVGRNTTQIAISRILKTYAFYSLTDVFGNIPYQSYGSNDPDFQALQQDPDNITPKYASQEKIYTDMLNELKAAGDTLLRYNTEKTFGAADIIYKGSNDKWAKFANSLRLRLATRLKAKNPALYKEHFDDAINKGVFTGNSDNAVFAYSTASPNEAPLYRATIPVNRTDFAVSDVFMRLLKGENSALPIVDPRLPIYASASSATKEYTGLPYGLTEAEAGKFAATNVSLPGAVINAANYAEVLLEYSEVQFLISEYKGWSKPEYEAGVQASLDKWGVSAADAATYIAALPVANQENVLNQKYIALYTQGLEAWSDYRRTGYPNFLLNKGDVNFQGKIGDVEVTYIFSPLFGDGGVPSRLYYPIKEQNVNKANYQQAIADQGNDRIETTLWVFRK
ncbi:SusD/RagB family nutrient-binding outer membrane lipoprotein [Dysgonomonas sp. ZJ279]|uniref:SusD/RagB family nutrient-binding outer membrane lipoprotein n=1 Tax=Dysgonomonas sp. ZJ279 TaxID=2709796 RepID=UPI0013EB32B3|nr:SusD/RagB family nutrient-binding outer membrane lipoprotein [Dysgonomonas sp. ZJ279]